MGGHLEIFKFGMYLFVPVFALLHFGDPTWYHENVLPYKDRLFPAEDRTKKRIPTDQSTVREELARIKTERQAKRTELNKAALEKNEPQS